MIVKPDHFFLLLFILARSSYIVAGEGPGNKMLVSPEMFRQNHHHPGSLRGKKK